MENSIGKICPFCKTAITEADEVKVCPACGIPHHKGCWEENHGCTTFGCSEQHYEAQHTNPVDVCVNCGAPLGDGQAFCPRCGTPKAAPQKKYCKGCGLELQEAQAFCPRCGQKVDIPVDPQLHSFIDQYNAGITQQQKNTKMVPIVLAIVAVVVIIIGILISNAVSAKRAEELRDEYLATAEEFLSLSLTAGSNLEDIADTVQTYWYENIWEDKHGYDINDAIYYALLAKSSEISLAESYNTRLRNLYSQLKKVPDGVSDEDKDDLEDICDAIKDLYNVYADYYTLATDPSGSYNSYSESNGDLTDEFLSSFRALDNLLD